MRLLLGMIIGALLTVLVVYIVDAGAEGASGVENPTMVNWDVVGQKVDRLTEDAQSIWTDFTREITGPP